MNLQEIAALGRKVRAVCPAQRVDADTPEAWAALLADVAYDDALEAVYHLGRSQQWIAPSDIIREVKRLRAARRRLVVVPAPAPEDADVPARYIARIRASVAAAAQGQQGGRLQIGSGERVRQWAAHGQRVVGKDHKPQVDRRPAGVRDALARAREACAEASAQVRTEQREGVPVPPAGGHHDPLVVSAVGDVVAGVREDLERLRGGR